MVLVGPALADWESKVMPLNRNVLNLYKRLDQDNNLLEVDIIIYNIKIYSLIVLIFILLSRHLFTSVVNQSLAFLKKRKNAFFAS